MEYVLAGCVLCSYLVFVLQEIRHQKERQNLLNRIMARDYHDYAVSERPKSPGKSGNFVQESIERAYLQRMNQLTEDE